MYGRRSDHEVRLRKCVSGLTAFLNQWPPFEHDVFADLQDATVKHWAHFLR